MGEIEKERIIDIVDRFPWNDLLDKMKGVKESDIHFSPSVEFENKINGVAMRISIVEGEEENEFYIFFKRPKMLTKWFGLVETEDNFISDRMGQTSKDVRDALTALIKDDHATLEKRWG